MIEDFATSLQKQLKDKLPGKTAHQEVAPYRNVNFNSAAIEAAKKSAVLILFYPKGNKIFTVLMQRTVYDGKHSGQISFPGGKVEPLDTSIFDTALREANEELGIEKDAVTVLGKLSDVFIPVSNFHVVPVIGYALKAPIFVLEKREVETIIELDIDELKNSILVNKKIKMSNNTLIKVPSFEFSEKIIWGATALMLNELRHILKA